MKLQALYERDRGLCHLCGQEVLPPGSHAKAPMTPTRDHVIPLMALKKNREKHVDNESNIKLAHKRCNHHKGHYQDTRGQGLDPFLLHHFQWEFDRDHNLIEQ